MKILLDTPALIWATALPEKLSPHAKAKMESNAVTEVLISSISIWEICMLLKKRRISLGIPFQAWLDTIVSQPRFSVVDVDTRIAVESCNLPGVFHTDPADQIIVATARIHDAVLITRDQKILGYPHVKAEW